MMRMYSNQVLKNLGSKELGHHHHGLYDDEYPNNSPILPILSLVITKESNKKYNLKQQKDMNQRYLLLSNNDQVTTKDAFVLVSNPYGETLNIRVAKKKTKSFGSKLGRLLCDILVVLFDWLIKLWTLIQFNFEINLKF